MSRSVYNWMSLVLLVLASGLFAYLVINIRELRSSVAQLQADKNRYQAERDALKVERDALKAERDALSQSTASLKRGNIDFTNTVLGDGDYIRIVAKALDRRCAPEHKQGCEFFIRYGRVLLARQDAVMARAAASTKPDYRRLIQLYETLNRVNQQVGWRSVDDMKTFKGASLEGMAYANLKLENIDLAADYSRRALAEVPHSALANLTALKVMCAQRKSPREIIVARNAALARIERRGAAARQENDPIGVRNASLNKDYVINDPELRQMCDIGLG